MSPSARSGNHIPEITFRDLLLDYRITADKPVVFTDEEQHAIDIGWAQFTESVNADAPPGQRLFVPQEVQKGLKEALASSSLSSLALDLAVGPSDSTVKNRILSAAVKSLVFSSTPLDFYNLANTCERVAPAVAACLYREFLRRRQIAGPQADERQVQAEEQAALHAEEWLAKNSERLLRET
jgi:hypothetical protein